jgi:ribosomal protein S18 acetylase RimI-like enzyme
MMPGYKIVPSTNNDLHLVYQFFDAAVVYQKRNNYPDWEGFDKKALELDMLEDRQYKIVIDEEIACVFSICLADKIIWKERDQNDAIYIHRIAVNPVFKGQKQFRKIMDWTIEYARANRKSFIRMDTWAKNPVIIEYYKSFGFEVLGDLTTPDTQELPIHNRNIELVLLEYRIP